MSAARGSGRARAPWALTAAAAIAVLAAAALGGIAAGRWAGAQASEPRTELAVIPDPAARAGEAAAGWTSRGGFTGFGGLPALPGGVLRAGRVAEAAPGRIVVGSAGGSTEIAFADAARLFEIAPARPIAAGDVVVVRIADGAAEAVLIVPPDLEQGSGRGGR